MVRNAGVFHEVILETDGIHNLGIEAWLLRLTLVFHKIPSIAAPGGKFAPLLVGLESSCWVILEFGADLV